METVQDSTASPPISDKRPILVPVDFSSCSSNALLFASQFVSCLRAPIQVLHVIHDESRKPGLYRGNGHQGSMRPIEDIALDMLAEFIADVRKASPSSAALESVETLLVGGLPARRIIEIAMREEAALIVMGTHGRSGLSRLASGSVAAEVVRRSPVPVTVVKAAAAGQKDAGLMSSAQWWERQARSESSAQRRGWLPEPGGPPLQP